MFRRKFGRRIESPAGLFNGPFFDVRTLYVLECDRMPSVSAVGEVEGSRVYAFILERCGGEVVKVWQHSFFDHSEGSIVFSRTILQLKGARMIEVGAEYCEVLHDADFAWANGLITALAEFRLRPKEAPIGFARAGNMN
jgi:hypothetical protein